MDLTLSPASDDASDNRQLRREQRRQVSLRAVLRSAALPQPLTVEIVDLTTGGARVRGAEVPVGSRVTLEFSAAWSPTAHTERSSPGSAWSSTWWQCAAGANPGGSSR
ncbi:MAG: hypothetical protein E6I52_01765 [Chloroflexi bacterium]|nr:MAG: hypothetical protein E6I52_01765 [Chloroflexota bacterium]